MICNKCNGSMKPLFTGFFCPNNCDKESITEEETERFFLCQKKDIPYGTQKVAWFINRAVGNAMLAELLTKNDVYNFCWTFVNDGFSKMMSDECWCVVDRKGEA